MLETLEKNNLRTWIKVWGEFACFTRPEMKVERVSYDVITPSAARGIIEAILWKPAITWKIEAIGVLKPIEWFRLRRNEITEKISERTVLTAMNRLEGEFGLNIEDNRTQRGGLFLRDVAYLIAVSPELTDKAGEGDNLLKFSEMLKRRAQKGQCFNQPYLGCREFSANFELIDDKQLQDFSTIDETRDLGWMLNDITHKDEIQPHFFRPKIEKGWIKVPSVKEEAA